MWGRKLHVCLILGVQNCPVPKEKEEYIAKSNRKMQELTKSALCCFLSSPQVMSQSLKDLQRALVGDIGFSSALEDLSTSLFSGKLPVMWARLVRGAVCSSFSYLLSQHLLTLGLISFLVLLP
jgi:hypothetical protein